MINYQNFKTLNSKILYLGSDDLLDYLESIEGVFYETQHATDQQIVEIRAAADAAIMSKMREIADDFLQMGDQNQLDLLLKLGITQEDALNLAIAYLLKNCSDYSSILLKLELFQRFFGNNEVMRNLQVFKLLQQKCDFFQSSQSFDEEFLHFKEFLKMSGNDF